MEREESEQAADKKRMRLGGESMEVETQAAAELASNKSKNMPRILGN